MQEQYLDSMELERERGITIKLQPVRMLYKIPNNKLQALNKSQIQNSNDSKLEIQNWTRLPDGQELEIEDSKQTEFVLNLIDTPGHVDFSYEVSRSLVAVEGAVLLVDATKGIQAQTLANLHLAQQQNLVIIPVINKVDMPNAKIEQVKEELSYLLSVELEKIIQISAKNGTNIEEVLERVIIDIPSPAKGEEGELKALIFDSTFDTYKGVIAFVRVFSGSIKKFDKITTFVTRAKTESLEIGYFAPALTQSEMLSAGDMGYIATGFKDASFIRVGDTITNYPIQSNFKPLAGYKEPKPMVFGSFFPENADDYDLLADSLSKLKLTDASLIYEPESSLGLGRGFRLGFLGMLHVEIISERLKREFGLNLVISTPSVEYVVVLKNGKEERIRSAAKLPDPSIIVSIAEPIVSLEIIAPSSYLGSVMDLVASYRNQYVTTEYLGKDTVVLKYDMPLAEIITDFYDKLKSVSSGYASMGYELKGTQVGDLVRLDVLVADDLVEPFSRIVPRDKAYYEGRMMVAKLKDTIPAQWFQIAIQAAIGGKIIARESIGARRKDVTGYLYGGDVTRKNKLLDKQKRGKKKMEEMGKVNIPQEVFLKMLKR